MRLSITGARVAAPSEWATVVHLPVPHNDVGLVQSLLVGQPGAVQVLGERFGADLLRVGMRILGPDPALSAVVHAGVRRALDRLSELREPRELRQWLMMHLISVLCRRLRARRFTNRVGMLLSVFRMSPGHNALQRSSSRNVTTYRLLDRLNDRERIVFCLSTFDGMYPAEIAATLETSVSNVRRLLERAELRVSKLRKHAEFSRR
jgi:RNA polymerase sigma factor (sigma-70 family)